MIREDKLIKAYEGKTAAELAKAPVWALQGVSAGDADRLKKAFGIDNIAEMAALKYYRRAVLIRQKAEEG